MDYQKIDALISIRTYANKVLDNVRIKLNKEQINKLDNKISEIDSFLVKEILNLEVK